MLHQRWKAKAAATQTQQLSTDSLATIVLKSCRAIDIITAEFGGPSAMLDEVCCFQINTLHLVKESFQILKGNIKVTHTL
jgi:hypothetical protein